MTPSDALRQWFANSSRRDDPVLEQVRATKIKWPRERPTKPSSYYMIMSWEGRGGNLMLVVHPSLRVTWLWTPAIEVEQREAA